jgi:hypothetical protein
VWGYWAVSAVAAAAVIALLGLLHRSSPAAPFPFPCLAQETLALHVHPYLRIVMEGQAVRVPAAVGIRDPRMQQGVAVGGSCFEPVHTHDASGIIHIEAPDPSRQYTLGDFFAVWRATFGTVRIGGGSFPVTYASDELLGHHAGGGHTIRLLVDGRTVASGPGLVLNALDYCSAQSAAPPCYPTAVGDPFPPAILRQYGTGHTILLEYK